MVSDDGVRRVVWFYKDGRGNRDRVGSSRFCGNHTATASCGREPIPWAGMGFCFAGDEPTIPTQPTGHGFWPLPCALGGPLRDVDSCPLFFFIKAPPTLMLISHHPLSANSMGLAKTNTTWTEIQY
jgi:hypothetical protein